MAGAVEVLRNRMQGAVVNAAADIAESAIIEGTALVKNGISNVLKKNKTVDVAPEPEDDESDDDSQDGDSQDDDSQDEEFESEESQLPIAFDCFTEDKNLECAAASWKLWGRRPDDCQSESDEPDIIAQFKTGLAFCGTMTQLQDFCEHNDLDEDVDVYGINENSEYDTTELDRMKVSKNIITYVMAFIADMYSSDSEEAFKGFHWDENATVTKVARTIPFMEEIPLTMCGVAQAIIYTAKKGDKVETYIHEFGEDSGLKPIMYALPTPEGEKWPSSLLIHGGKMRVEDRGICD